MVQPIGADHPGLGSRRMQEPPLEEVPLDNVMRDRKGPRDACPSALVRYVQVTRSPSRPPSRAFLRGPLVGSAPDTSPHPAP